MGRNDECFCGSGKKQKKCHSNVEQDSYMAKLYKRYSKVDDLISEYRDNHEEFKNHPCGKGCYNCCYDVFSITMLEFELLLEELRNTSLEFAEKVFEKALDDLRVLRTNSPELYKRLEEDVTFQRNAHHQDVGFYSKVERFPFPCPLLDVNEGSCGVYNKRPMICRLFGTTHDPLTVILASKDESSVCEHIPSVHVNALQTPEIDPSDSRISDMLKTKFSGQEIEPRSYPIVYWFKIYHDKNLKKGRPVYSSLVPSFYHKKEGTITIVELMP
ncbi:YkgJ family cysteine cluster protein [Bacillus wiedmannii]|uniref:Zinc/iron-chelating domain-containing protein n=1 Tax=Bacillus wiedmannii TaxID=1890302 RepID=A0ABX5DJJ3_9BACI|nr:YkgJ family cysteine cluster protein [Bacillus wiedmannii]PRT33864.1 hypothetical protein C6357_31115 [Bacillus wiedmannii]